MYQDRTPDAGDLETMIRLMGAVMRGFKGAGARGEERLIDTVRSAGLGPRHVPVLFVLVLNGPLPVGEIARHLALNPATVSQLVGELRRGGFVERRPDESDRRRMIISLHGPHRSMVESFARARLEPMRMALAALSDVERAHFLHGWHVLAEMQERYATGDTGRATQGEDECGEPRSES